jgi:hypothetical protein
VRQLITDVRRRKEPRVNLLPSLDSRRGFERGPISRGVLAMAALAVLSWAVAAAGLAIFLGWHPGIGVGP